MSTGQARLCFCAEEDIDSFTGSQEIHYTKNWNEINQVQAVGKNKHITTTAVIHI